VLESKKEKGGPENYCNIHPNIYCDCIEPGLVALTFDDGPTLETGDVLQILNTLHVNVTFFVNGYNINNETEDIIKLAYLSGHQIASHTYNHRSLQGLGTGIYAENIYQNEIDQNEIVFNTIMSPYGGYLTKYLRPPYLQIDNDAANALNNRGYKVIQTNLPTADFKNITTNDIIQKFKNIISNDNTSNSYITLQHDTHIRTHGAIQPAVEYIRSNGYRLVTVAECLGYNI